MDIINKNALHRFLIRNGSDQPYSTLNAAIMGKAAPGTISEALKKKLIKLLDQTFEEVKQNILKS
jgi:hypothetical protein